MKATVDTFFKPVRSKKAPNAQLPVRTCTVCKAVFFDENARRFTCAGCLRKSKHPFSRQRAAREV